MRVPETEQPRSHIAFFLPDLEMGGAERVFLTLSSALAQRGHVVELILARKSGPLVAEVDPNVSLVDLGAYRPGEPSWRFGLRTVLRLAWRLRRHTPDALFSTLTGANLSAIAARVLSHRRFRLFIREAATLANVKSRARQWLMWLLYPLADRVIVLTNFMREQLLTKLHLPAEKMVVIGNPVDATKIGRLAQDAELVRRAQEFHPYVVCVGRLSEPKDQATTIKAVARIAALRPLSLVLVGEGPLENKLQRLVCDLGIDDRVHFVGWQANPYPWMAQALVFVMSSRWEGYPNVLLEAEALRVPIVATKYDVSVEEVLTEKERVRIVEVGNDVAMAEAIQALFDETDGREKLVKSDNLDWVVDAYEACLEECSMRSVNHS